MSLRSVHILFILASLSLMGFLAYWSGHRLLSDQNGMSRGLMCCAVIGILGGIAYLAWFIRKTKSLG